MQICFAPYPQTIEQMAEWAEKVTQLDQHECAIALHKLDSLHAPLLRKE